MRYSEMKAFEQRRLARTPRPVAPPSPWWSRAGIALIAVLVLGFVIG